MGQHSAKVYHEKPNDDSTPARQLYSKGAHTKRQFSSGVATDIGGRPYQEDRYIVIDNLQSYSPHVTVPSALYIVLDGHGGFQCAEFVKTNFVDIFCQTEEFQSCDYAAALRVTFKKLEKTWVEYAVLSKMEGWSSGTCVLASFVVQSGMYVAWVGDCRMAGYNDHDQKHVQHVTTDHKPGSPKELSRILKVGGSVKHVHVHGGCFRSVKGPDRVFPGGLAVARSIGTIRCKDARLGAVKGAVISDAEVYYFTPSSSSNWFVMASDGLWDYYPKSQQLSKIICNKKDSVVEASDMAKYIMGTIRTSRRLNRAPDNCTILVIKMRIEDDDRIDRH